jgi:Papain-like cysteine protease AvrRpt2
MSTASHSALWNARTPVSVLPDTSPNPLPPPVPKLSLKTLDITVPYQQQFYWCWVATGSGIASWYDKTVYQQCYVVTLVFTDIVPGFDTNCCSSSVNAAQPPCNAESGADQALNHPAHHFNYNTGPGTFGWADIVGQINEGRPFVPQIDWAGGGAHFVAITGYMELVEGGVKYVYVQDPVSGPGWYTLSSFSSSYQGDGTWGWTTLSQP